MSGAIFGNQIFAERPEFLFIFSRQLKALHYEAKTIFKAQNERFQLKIKKKNIVTKLKNNFNCKKDDISDIKTQETKS